MRCRYCFYDDVSNHRIQKNFGLMSRETAEKLIESAFSCVGGQGEINFSFQGGEPTLAGISFYRSFMELEEKYKRSDIRISHSIQTNGYLLDEKWAEFLRNYNFLVGLSIDGTQELHDLYRKDRRGQGTYQVLMRALQELRSHDVEVNLLCVVTRQCARRPQHVYSKMKELGVPYLQFIPCLEPIGAPRGKSDYALMPKHYGKFLCGLFDMWYQDWKNGKYVSIRFFDDYIHMLIGRPSGSCATSGQCGTYVVVESDGSFYPCDFYVLDEWCTGTISTDTIEDVLRSDVEQRFLLERNNLPHECRKCKWYPLCRGGCKRDWQLIDGQYTNYFCRAFQMFFPYVYPRLQEIAQAELRMLQRIKL